MTCGNGLERLRRRISRSFCCLAHVWREGRVMSRHPNTNAVLAGVAVTVVGLVLWFRLSTASPPLPRSARKVGHVGNKEYWKLDATGNFVESFGSSFIGFLETGHTKPVWGSVLQRLGHVGAGSYRP